MKKFILLILFLFVIFTGFSQIVKYDNYQDTKLHRYSTYISKSGDFLNIGDTLIIGEPSGAKSFNFIQQGLDFGTIVYDSRISNTFFIPGKKVIISEIRIYKNNLFIAFKGYGLLPIYIQYEKAIKANEVKKPK